METQPTLENMMIKRKLITPEDLARIRAHARSTNVTFQKAAMELDLASRDAIEELVLSQFDYPTLDPKGSGYSGKLTLAFEPLSAYGKAIRRLRSNLLRKIPGGRDASIAVLGPARPEHVSSVAANLAIALSQLGQSALLVDSNLSNPVLADWFDQEAETGVVSALLNHMHPGEVISRLNGFQNLSLIPSGLVPPNPADAFNKHALTALNDHVRDHFDMRIYNTPPLSEITSAELVADVCGNAICVVEEGRSSYDQLNALVHTLRKQGTRVLGAILRK